MRYVVFVPQKGAMVSCPSGRSYQSHYDDGFVFAESPDDVAHLETHCGAVQMATIEYGKVALPEQQPEASAGGAE